MCKIITVRTTVFTIESRFGVVLYMAMVLSHGKAVAIVMKLTLSHLCAIIRIIILNDTLNIKTQQTNFCTGSLTGTIINIVCTGKIRYLGRASVSTLHGIRLLSLTTSISFIICLKKLNIRSIIKINAHNASRRSLFERFECVCEL